MIRTFFKLALCILVYTIIFTLANALMPFSQGFKELGASDNSLGLLFMLINSIWVCFTMYFITRHTGLNGKKLFFNIVFIMFFVQPFMTQIETLFFGDAFPVLTKMDVILIMLAGLFPLLATAPLLIKFFQNKNIPVERKAINVKTILAKLGIIGVLYLCVYMLFGYFVAWQFEALRVFYTGSPEKLSFWGQLANNIQTNPVIFSFQILRGILFGVFVLPLISMIGKKSVFIITVCLVYLSTAVLLLIPNVLFPDMVRIGHLVEMASSMLVFGVIVGNILWERNFNSEVTHE